ncbi:MAG: tetratricopeptide repeat protein [candidate division Zixibacteria bacterium]|nr:tetratricopeptide repeat protein [candidate division Zixibacteria bacterium]
MYKLLLSLFVTLLLPGGFSYDLSAQETPPVQRRAVRTLSELEQQLAFARNLIRVRNFEGASALLEVIFEKEPDNEVVQNLLKQCYAELKYYTKSEALIRRFIEKHPESIGYYLDLAEVLIYQGRTEEGTEVYNRAVALVKNSDSNRYLLIINSMIASGLDSRALLLIDSLRLIKTDKLLFSLERGGILEKQKKYRDAAMEYLPLLSEDTTQTAGQAENKLFDLLEFVESSKEVEEVLLNQARRTSDWRILKLLSIYYIKTGNFEEAFEFTVRLDSLDNNKGEYLLFFMRQCYERRQYEQVIRMGTYALNRYSASSAVVNEVNYSYAEALTATGRYDEAIAVYLHIRDMFPHDRDKADALSSIGEIYLDKLNDYPRALAYFDTVATTYRSGFGYLNALRSTPLCYLRLGQYEKARESYHHLLRNRLNDDILEEAYYNLARLDFFQGRFDSASTALHKLIVDYPRGFYVNDALCLILVIDEAETAPELLADYARALWFEENRMTDSTKARLTRIADADNKALADIALFQLAQLNLTCADTSAALIDIERLVKDYPDSYYLPFGMKTRADIMVRDNDKKEEAREIYRFLLENFPNYPFISEVREIMRRLEKDIS